MEKRILIDSRQIDIMIDRLCRQLIENHSTFENSAILGLQPRGVALAIEIQKRLNETLGINVPLGTLDVTFNRDDFRRKALPLRAYKTEIDFHIEEMNVILVDDVLYKGRTIRAALDAMLTFGRPSTVELLVLVDRKYSREVPIEPHYVGKQVNSKHSQHVKVEWKAMGFDLDQVWLEQKEN